MPGKYFVAVSKLNGLVLDISGGNRNPGAHVITYHRKPDNNQNQQWYMDHATHTIRSRLNNFCLDINGQGDLVVNPYNASRNQQKWRVGDKRSVLCQVQDGSMVIDIKAMNREPGARLCSYKFKGGPAATNQQWVFDYVPPEYLYIVSAMHEKALEVNNGDVVMRKLTGSGQQQWYESQQGIRAKSNDFPLTTEGPVKERAKMITKRNTAGNTPEQHFWVRDGNKIVSRGNHNLVCDIGGQNRDDGAKVIAFPYKNQHNQHWIFKPAK